MTELTEEFTYDHPAMTEVIAKARFDLGYGNDKSEKEVYDAMMGGLKMVLTCPTQVNA